MGLGIWIELMGWDWDCEWKWNWEWGWDGMPRIALVTPGVPIPIPRSPVLPCSCFSPSPCGISQLIPAHLHKQGLIIPVFPGTDRDLLWQLLGQPGGKPQIFSCWDPPGLGTIFPGFLGSGKTLAQQNPPEFGVGWGQSQIPISWEFQRFDPQRRREVL